MNFSLKLSFIEACPLPPFHKPPPGCEHSGDFPGHPSRSKHVDINESREQLERVLLKQASPMRTPTADQVPKKGRERGCVGRVFVSSFWDVEEWKISEQAFLVR